MAGGRRGDSFDVKWANIRHHDVEAEVFERVHPEGSSIYERAKVSKSIAYIAKSCRARDLCVDVGCGTGFVTGFELPHYKMVVAADISKRMLDVAKRRLGGAKSLCLVVCDAEFLPFKRGVADLVSVSSLLHHLPRPFSYLKEVSRILKVDGFVYVTREPSYQRFRRFFDFLDRFVVQRFLRLVRFLRSRLENVDLNTRLDGLDYAAVDVHYPMGFHFAQLSRALGLLGFEVVSAYSYHWIYPDSNRGWLQTLLTKSNFLIERFPLSNKLGRYVSIIARKHVKDSCGA
ncbi:class I SAM-dependent methyltransferase [Candidatus Bathyarchaeota archaeon]|nr:class I SAM-dependent methyltransferase [Candidatus Bathyarchaeota archaeon]